MKSRCDTGRIATISIPDGGIRVPTMRRRPRSPIDRTLFGRIMRRRRRSGDPGSRRRPVGRRAEHSALQRAAHPPRHSRRFCWPAVFAPLLLASCQPAGVLDPQGPIASAERLLLINSTAIMLVVVVPVIVATLGVRLVVPVVQHPRQPQPRTSPMKGASSSSSGRSRR